MSKENETESTADVMGKFLARSHTALLLAEGTPEKAELEKRVALTLLGANAHALQQTLPVGPHAIILALRELADIGEQKLLERGEWPES